MTSRSKPSLARRLALWVAMGALIAGVFSPGTSATPVSSLGPVNLWIGLTNSDDVGIRFDVKVEITGTGGAVLGTGQLDSIAGGSSGFNNASVRNFSVTPVAGADIVPGNPVGLKIYVRNACVGSGKNSGRMRLWFNDAEANSRFYTDAGGSLVYYLRSGPSIDGTPGPGPKATIDTLVGAKCGPWVLVGGGNGFGGSAGNPAPDTTAPTLTIDAPANGSSTTAASITVSGTVADASAVTVTVNGQNAPVNAGAFSAEVALAVGSNTITVVATDAANNQTTQTRTVTRTSGVPTITLASPVSGAVVKSPVTVTGTIGGGVAPLTVDVNGTAATVNGNSYTASVIVADGAQTLTATVHSSSGETAQASVNVVVDSTAPVISVTSPGDNQFVSAQTVEVTGGVSDASAVTLTVDGQSTPVTGGSFTASVAVSAGPTQTITLVATDAAGNASTVTRTLNIDRVAPTVAIASPTPGAYVKGPLVTVTGTATDVNTVVVDVNGSLTAVTNGTFSVDVPASDGPFTITATASDAAGNSAAANVAVVVDSAAPSLTITSPADGALINTPTVHITGTVADGASVTLTIGGEAVPVVGGAFEHDVPTAGDGTQLYLITATDAAGNETTVGLNVVVDRTLPTLSIAGPEDGAFITTLPLTVSGLATDQTALTITVNGVAATRVADAWEASLTTLTDGNQTLTVVARDAAGNETVVTRSISVDVNAPVLSLTSPASGLLTQAASVLVTGTVADSTLSTVTVNGVTASLTAQAGGATFTATVPLDEGDNVLAVVASDGTGRSSTASVTVTRDSIAPSLEISAPARVTRRVPGQATVTASDNLTLAQVSVTINGAPAGAFSTPPIAVDLTIPDGAAIGDTLTVVAVATDTAGNATTATRVVRITGDGAVVGQVLSDTTGLPVPGATVKLGVAEATSDARGQYTFPTAGASALVEVTLPGTVPVERAVVVQPEVGTVMVDARLTPLANAVTVPSSGGSVTNGALVLTVPSSALSADAAVRLTPFSPQGLPGLLPLGWSPLGAADVRADVALGAMTLRATLPAAVATGPGALTSVVLAQYDATLHAWTLATGDVPVTNGAVEAPIAGPGAFAFVVADVLDPVLPPVAVGGALPAATMVSIPATATSAGSVSPAILSPSGGTAAGLLAVQSPVALPSGTLVQADVTESFTLTAGNVASEEKRRQDVILYRVPAPAATALPDGFVPGLSATFPITPSRTFAAAALASGNVHLDILAGRESVRGQVGGGLATTVTSGGAQVSVAAGAAPNDTVIAIQPTVLSTFVPAAAGIEALGELVLDLGGQTLASPATLSIAAPGLSVAPTDTLLIARVERFDGVPSFVVVSMAAFQAGRVASVASPGLPGITVGGRYVFYRVTLPLGWAQASVTAGGTATAGAVISTAALPFVGLTNAAGQSLVPATAGTVTFTARVPRTALAGAADAVIVAGATTPVAIALEGTTTTATVTPSNGATGVAVTAQVEIESTVPLQALTVTTTNVRLLLDSDSTVVASQLLLSSSGHTLSVVPTGRLAPATRYRLEAGGLADMNGGLVLVPATAFTTAADTALVVDPSKLTFAMPDSGQSTVSAPPGTFAAGTTVLVINTGNGAVVTFTAQNDGSLTGTMTASTVDRLLITITDPLGRTTTLQRSAFVAADGTTAVGAGGGIVVGTGGTELRVPEGAIDTAATFKVESFDYATRYPDAPLPDLPGVAIGGAMTIRSDTFRFKQEIDLVFPRPAAAPEGSFFYFYRRLEGPNGQFAYEVLDHGVVEGTGPDRKVVTASKPFPGFASTFSGYSFSDVSGVAGLPFLDSQILLAYAWDALKFDLPGTGLITGRVVRPVFEAGQEEPRYVGVPDVTISGVDSTNQPLYHTDTGQTIGVTQSDGTFALWDWRFAGGTVTISATVGGETRTGVAFELPFGIERTPAAKKYQSVADVTITFPPAVPPPPPPAIDVKVFQEVNGNRVETGGLVTAGTPLVIGFSVPPSATNPATLLDPTVNGEIVGIKADPKAGSATGMQMILNDAFTPATAGTVTIIAKARPLTGSVVERIVTLRVVAAGGGVTDPAPNDPPAVITAQTSPKSGAVGVPVTVFPQISFTEPVRNIPGSVTLLDQQGQTVPFAILGAGLSGPIDNLQDAAAVVTGITIQPLVGLKYNTRYTLSLSADITDLDTPQAKHLSLFLTSFTTFGPEGIGSSAEAVGTGGLVVMGERAYIGASVVSGLGSSRIRVFDVTDPVSLPEVTGPDGPIFIGSPWDLAGDPESPLTGGPVLALVTTRTRIPYGPSNLHLIDVSTNTPKWIGAVTLGITPIDGIGRRVILHGERAFVLTAGQGKGLQIIDLPQAQANLAAIAPQTPAYYEMLEQLGLEGQAFGLDAILSTVFIDTGAGNNSQQADLAVVDMNVDGIPTPLAITTGRRALAIVNPLTSEILYSGPVKSAAGTELISYGMYVAGGFVGTRPVAFVAGLVGPGRRLAVVDLTNPRNPVALEIIDLPAGVLDTWTRILFKDGMLYLGGTAGTTLVNVSDPTRPRIAGTIPGTGGFIALTDANLLVSSDHFYRTEHGLQAAAMSAIAIVKSYKKDPIVVSAADEVFQDTDIEVRLLPPDPRVSSATVHVGPVGGAYVATLPTPITNGNGKTQWPKGTIVNPSIRYTASVEASSEGVPIPGPARVLHFDKVPLAISSRDRLLRIQFALAEQGLFIESKYGVKVYLAPRGGTYPDVPSFALTSAQIEGAYPNVESWWGDVEAGSEKAKASWVTRKIDKIALPPGTDTAIRRQAFEIGAVLAGYPQVRVVVVSEDTGQELARSEGTVTRDGEWSAVLNRVTTRLAQSAGTPLDDDQPLPDESFDPANAFQGWSGLAYRALYQVIEAAVGVDLFRGMVDGFVFGWNSDVELVALLATSAANPKNAAETLASAIKEKLEYIKNPRLILEKISGIHLDFEKLLNGTPYFGGFVIGFVLEQAIVKVAVTAALSTTGAGAVALAGAVLRQGSLMAGLIRESAALIKSVGVGASRLAKLGAETKAANKMLKFFKSSKELLVKVWEKYPDATAAIERVSEAVERAGAAGTRIGTRALYWLGTVDRMSDKGAVMIIGFIQRLDVAMADRWMARWVALPSGARAVAGGFDAAAAKFGEEAQVAESLHHWLVTTADVEDAAAASRLANRASQADLEAIAARLQRDIDDTRYPARAQGQVGSLEADPTTVPMTPDSAEGFASILAKVCP